MGGYIYEMLTALIKLGVFGTDRKWKERVTRWSMGNGCEIRGLILYPYLRTSNR